jgi:hypothetical protein
MSVKSLAITAAVLPVAFLGAYIGWLVVPEIVRIVVPEVVRAIAGA